jgi:TPR repeat protein
MAQYVLWEMLYFGDGVAAKKEEAVMWLEEAAKSRDDIASLAAAQLADVRAGKDLSGYWKAANETSEAREKRLLAEAADDPQKQWELGCNYYNGVGRPRDLKQALIWVEKAAALKNARAVSFLPKLKREIEEGLPPGSAGRMN